MSAATQIPLALRAAERQSPHKQHSLALTPPPGKPGSPLTVRGTGERPSRGWGSFSVALSLTFNENKQAGMGRRCGRAAWPCAGPWLSLHRHRDAQRGAVPAAMPLPGEKQLGVKNRVGAAARGSRRDGAVPSGGERRGHASCPGQVGDTIFTQVLAGWAWRWALQHAGLAGSPRPLALAWGLQAGGKLGWIFSGCFSEPAQQLQLLSQCG